MKARVLKRLFGRFLAPLLEVPAEWNEPGGFDRYIDAIAATTWAE